jgi:hypothetical protein
MAFITVSEEDIFSMNQELRDIGWTGLDSEDSESWATGSFEKEKSFSEEEAKNLPAGKGAEERRRKVVTLADGAVRLWKTTMTVTDDDAERATVNRNLRARLAALRVEVGGLTAEQKKTGEVQSKGKPLEKLISRLQAEIAMLEEEVSTEEQRVRLTFYNADEAMRQWEETLKEAKKVDRYNIEGTRCRYKKNVSCGNCNTHFLPRNTICTCTQVRYCSKKCQTQDWEYGHKEAHIRARKEKKGLLKEAKEAKKASSSTKGESGVFSGALFATFASAGP